MDGEDDRGNYEDRHTPETGPKKVKKPKAKAKKKKTFRQVTKKMAKAHPKTAKKVKRPKVAKKTKRKAPATIARPERLDMRLSKAEKNKLLAKAKKLRRTVTSIMLEAIEKIK